MSDDELAQILLNNTGGWQTPDVSFANVTISGALLVEDADGQYVYIFNAPGEGPKIDLAPANYGPNVSPAGLLATTIPNGGDPYDVLVIKSPYNSDVPVDYSTITIGSGSVAQPGHSGIFLDAYSVAVSDALNGFGNNTMAGFGDIGRGIVAVGSSASDSGAIGTTETTALTIPSFTYEAGRAYRADIMGRLTQSAAGDGPVSRIRKTSVAGASIFSYGRIATNGSGEMAPPPPIYFTTPNTVTAAIAYTLTASTGTVTQKGPRAVIISDVGLAVALPNMPTLT